MIHISHSVENVPIKSNGKLVILIYMKGSFHVLLDESYSLKISSIKKLIK